MIIYYIKNKINGKLYIGQTTKTIDKRIANHLQQAKIKTDRKLYNAIRKYGWDNFEYGIICHCDTLEELNQKETEYIVRYDTIKMGYNMGLGGDNNVMFCEQTKQKHDSIMRSPEIRSKISETMKKIRQEHGFSKTTRDKISHKLKGNQNGLGKKRPIEAIEKTCKSLYKKVSCFNGKDELVFNSVKEACIWWNNNGICLKHLASVAEKIKKSADNNVYINGLIWKYI